MIAICHADISERFSEAPTPTFAILTGEMSSKIEMRVRRPSIDQLVHHAQMAGKSKANRTTIRHWVRRGDVDPPRREGRDYRYPLTAIGQVHTLARFNVREHGHPMVRFALFVETGSVPVAEALNIAADWIGRMSAEIDQARNFATDTDLYRREVQEAAAKRGRNSVLPRQVAMSAEERMLAVAQFATLIFGAGLPEVPEGLGMLERAIGLRSGRGGAEREIPFGLTERDIEALDPGAMHAAVLAASPLRAAIARNLVELCSLWLPALVPSLLSSLPASESKFLEIAAAQATHLTPKAYVFNFAGFLAMQDAIPDVLLEEARPETEPAWVTARMLSTQPAGDLPGVLKRLGPFQRLKLEYVLRAAAPAVDVRPGAQ